MSVFNILEPKVSKVVEGLEGKIILVYGGNSNGKAQPLSEPVLTEHGFRPMGDVKVGDRVYGEDGKLHNVTNVYPQGVKDVYEVVFTDGTGTRCCKEHLWKVHTRKQCENMNKYKDDRHKILTLEEMMKDYKKLNSKGQEIYKYCIPVTESIEFKEQDVDFDPYILGLLIGDGGFSGSTVTFTNPESDLVEKVKNYVEELGYSLTQHKGNEIQYNIVDTNNHKANHFSDKLRKMELMGKRSHEKFIPKEYLFNTEEVRLQMLRGLLDSDGCINLQTTGTPMFSSVSKKLIDDVSFIVRSLGGITGLIEDKRENKECFTLSIRLKNQKLTTSRKHEERIKKGDKSNPLVKKTIKKIQKLDTEEMQCITVDNPSHLYITNQFIVTHNTLQGTRMKKPLVLPFEHGLNAISGIPYFPVNSWSDFKKINMSLTKTATLDKVKDMYQTIIFDEVQASANYCQDYICAKYDAESIKSGNGGFGLWKEYETEYWKGATRFSISA